MSDVKRVAYGSTTLKEMRGRMASAADEWWACARRLYLAAFWFIDHDAADPDFTEAVATARELEARMFRARLDGGNTLLAYVAGVRALPADRRAFEEQIAGMPVTEPGPLWRAQFPCPHACTLVAFSLAGGADAWWERTRLGEPPDCGGCMARCLADDTAPVAPDRVRAIRPAPDGWDGQELK
jgi:hypothetical protein